MGRVPERTLPKGMNQHPEEGPAAMMGTSICSCSQVGTIEEYSFPLGRHHCPWKTLPEIYTYDLKLLTGLFAKYFPIYSFLHPF